MAPRHTSGGSSGYSTASCPNAYTTTNAQSAIAYYVLFLVLFMGVFILTFFIRKKSGAGKKLIGIPFVIALFLQVISRLLDLISDVMYECSELSYIDYWNVMIASNVMSSLADWALLIIIVYILNSMLFKQLESSSSATKTVLRIIVGIMFAVVVADMVLSNYLFSRNDYLDYDLVFLARASGGLSLTLDVLWLISIIVSATISLSSISAMRSKRLPGGDLVGWVSALYVTQIVYSILGIVFTSSVFWPERLPRATSLAFSFILGLSLVLTFIILLCIAKHISWNQTTAKTEQIYTSVMQQQATYGYSNGQQDYYQQTPELVYVR